MMKFRKNDAILVDCLKKNWNIRTSHTCFSLVHCSCNNVALFDFFHFFFVIVLTEQALLDMLDKGSQLIY